MRLLIGSDEPISLGKKADIRSWAQRLLWFAEPGDAVVLNEAPDPAFVDHVTGLTGVDGSTLRFHVMPSRWPAGNFDAWGLLDRTFQTSIVDEAAAASAVVALWPNPEVGWLVQSLGIGHKLPGAAFWREGGGILANSKVVFRALAGGVGAPVPSGGVCRSADDAFHLSGHLLTEGHAFVVKRDYGGGGTGNEIVATRELAVSHAGHAAFELVEPTAESLQAYWARRWQWASNHGTDAVVVEAFVADARTLYVEISCDDDPVGAGKIGELKFVDGRIAREIVPAQDITATVRSALMSAARRLAAAYRSAGYRGHLSLDAVVAPNGRHFFTEANARFTTSTHLHGPIADKVARVSDQPERVIVQWLSTASSHFESLGAFLEMLKSQRLAFDPTSRRGLFPITPFVHGTGQLMLAAVAENEAAADDLIACVHRAIVHSNLGEQYA